MGQSAWLARHGSRDQREDDVVEHPPVTATIDVGAYPWAIAITP
jgi:hypothetical protein